MLLHCPKYTVVYISNPKVVFLNQKRRSARHTNKRKKYLDDIDLNLSDDEGTMLEPLEGTDGPVAMKTVCGWVCRSVGPENLPLLRISPPQLISVPSFCYSHCVCVCVFPYNALCKLFWQDCPLRMYRILYLG